MRLIWTTELGEECALFCAFLQEKGIEARLDTHIETNWDSDTYGIPVHKLWIYDEERVDEAKKWLTEFLQKPPAPKTSKRAVATSKFSFSRTLIAICTAIFLITSWTQKPLESLPREFRDPLFFASPTEKALLFDYPKAYELLDTIGSKYGYSALLHPKEIPASGEALYQSHLAAKVWPGLYPALTARSLAPVEGTPLFEKIRTGELWRLISPIFLHGDLLHLIFNMMWLLLLGVEIERHLTLSRYALLILVSAIISNTAQYLMSGCAFIGFSGVVCALAFFIYRRQRVAPWEGYRLPRSTFQFLFFFIVGLTALSIFSFSMEFFGFGRFPIQIANTAHLVGAAVGYFAGKRFA